MKIIIATHNKGKLSEFQNILKDFDCEIVDAFSEGIDVSDIEETGSTYEENALLKARAVYERSGHFAIADDSGISIEVLPNILGVYSARFMGENTPYLEKNNALINLLNDESNRKAVFTSVIAFVGPNTEKVFEGNVRGDIAKELMGDKGFGYDPIFIPEGYSLSYAQMTLEEKNKMSHRALALNQFRDFFKGFKHAS